ncbi:MAG: carbohydrate ABC transporter permease [Thermotogae bacterium]|nr:carbohydrate ABC transporter permease [Thermotogota bacterium]
MKRKRISREILFVIFFVLAIIWLYPYVWLFLSSVKPTDQIYTTFIPRSFTLDHYKFLFTKAQEMGRPFLLALFNSIFMSITVTISVILTSAIIGYAVAKIDFKGGRFLNNFVIFQMLLPGFMFIIPLFFVVKALGLLDTYGAVIIPGLTSAWGVFMFAQSFKSIPSAYIEAARMDGAGELWIVFRIMLPLSRSTASIVGLFTFIGTWDNFLWPLIVIRNYRVMPLSVLLATFNHEYGAYIGPVLAASAIQSLPMVIIFLIFRKYFLQGISMSLK